MIKALITYIIKFTGKKPSGSPFPYVFLSPVQNLPLIPWTISLAIGAADRDLCLVWVNNTCGVQEIKCLASDTFLQKKW